MTKQNQSVSVIVPFYGQFNRERTEICLESLREQKKVDLEIIISEQNPEPTLQEIVKKYHAKHIFEPYLEENNDFRPGRVRNNGLVNASGEFIYTNDGDICFINPEYLSMLAELSQQEKTALYHPPMRRILLQDFDRFKSLVHRIGFGSAIQELVYDQDYIAKMDSKEIALKIIDKETSKGPRRFVTTQEDFARYLASDELKGKEPTILNHVVHYGGNFFRTSDAKKAGYYCEEFINWGCEDSDMQWKLSQIGNFQKIPETAEFEVLHLDHLKGYFENQHWKANKKLAEQRTKQPIEDVIKHDIQTRLLLGNEQYK